MRNVGAEYSERCSGLDCAVEEDLDIQKAQNELRKMTS